MSTLAPQPIRLTLMGKLFSYHPPIGDGLPVYGYWLRRLTEACPVESQMISAVVETEKRWRCRGVWQWEASDMRHTADTEFVRLAFREWSENPERRRRFLRRVLLAGQRRAA